MPQNHYWPFLIGNPIYLLVATFLYFLVLCNTYVNVYFKSHVLLMILSAMK